MMNLAVLYHASPTMLREKIYNALDEFLPDLDEGCRERGCIAMDHFKEKPLLRKTKSSTALNAKPPCANPSVMMTMTSKTTCALGWG